jgi:hypothetical protein
VLRVVVALVSLVSVAGCTTVDGVLPAVHGPSPPPAALLEGSWMSEPPVDPRFADALIHYASALEDLPGHRGADFQPHLHTTLRLLADAVALVPSSASWRLPAYRTANAMRSEVAQMEITSAGDARVELASAGRALVAAAELLRAVAAREYGGSPDVLEAARRFAGDSRAVGPDHPRATLLSALHAAEDVLQAMLRVAVSG